MALGIKEALGALNKFLGLLGQLVNYIKRERLEKEQDEIVSNTESAWRAFGRVRNERPGISPKTPKAVARKHDVADK